MRKSSLWKHFLHLIEGYKRDGVQRASGLLWTTKNNKRLCQLSREMNSWRWQKGSASESLLSESKGLSSERRTTGQRTAGNEDRCWWSVARFQGRLKAGLGKFVEICCWRTESCLSMGKWWWMGIGANMTEVLGWNSCVRKPPVIGKGRTRCFNRRRRQF